MCINAGSFWSRHVTIFQSSKYRVNEGTHHGKREGFVITQSISVFFYFFPIIGEQSGSFSSITEVGAGHLSEPKEAFLPRGRSRFAAARLTPESPSSV